VLDERFSRTFGAIPAADAADRAADAAAARAARIAGTAPKLLVTDLDGTLWTGTLAEDGASRIVLGEAYPHALKTLAEDGLLLAIASRNDPRDVDAAFAAHPEWPLSRRAFIGTAVGWEEKDELVGIVLDKLGLGAEHTVFVDDDPVNCAKVAARFPAADVRLVAGDRQAFAAALLADPLLRQAHAADGDRAEQYRRRDAVERLRDDAADVDEFLRRLGTVLTVVPLRPSLMPRAAELASRVNQFATNDRRPNARELADRHSPLDFMIRLDDAFGAHGLVGLVLASVAGRKASVEAIFLSCRALGRGVEDAMLAALGRLAREAGCDRIVGSIDALTRNEPARRYFSQHLDAANSRSWTVRLGAEATAPEGTTLRWAKTTT
jgi:FkbH-like protein